MQKCLQASVPLSELTCLNVFFARSASQVKLQLQLVKCWLPTQIRMQILSFQVIRDDWSILWYLRNKKEPPFEQSVFIYCPLFLYSFSLYLYSTCQDKGLFTHSSLNCTSIHTVFFHTGTAYKYTIVTQISTNTYIFGSP